jgi:nucleoside-diphosphate-sugar epimerase
VVIGERDLPGTILRYPMIYGPNDGGRTLDKEFDYATEDKILAELQETDEHPMRVLETE